jgi:DNA-directed RNA polymerase II subunit RPB9
MSRSVLFLTKLFFLSPTSAIKKEVGNILQNIPGSVRDDPTLPKSKKAHCGNCGHNEAVFLHTDTGQTDSLALVFVCCNCEHKWVNSGSAQ